MPSADDADSRQPVAGSAPDARRVGPSASTGRRFSAAIVLAGGESRRFGTDKLAHRLDGRPLLDHTLDGLGSDWSIYLVGPPRVTEREVVAVREEPPGGGPTAGLIAGLRAALADGAELLVVLPGDAPLAGMAARSMHERLRVSPEVQVLIGVTPDGRQQPLQLALRRAGAEQLIALAGPEAGSGASARRLVRALDPQPVVLSSADAFDIDDRDALARWIDRSSS